MQILGINTENTLVRIGAAGSGAALIGAALYWFVFTASPVVAGVAQSAKPPWASEKEVSDVQVAMTGLKQGQSATQARFRAQQINDEIVQQAILMKLALAERDDILAGLKKNPSDKVYRDSLRQNDTDIQGIKDTVARLKKQLGTSGY